jgi:hypothetical protein
VTLRLVPVALLAAAAIALAAPASAQAPGMVPGVHDVHLKGIGEVRFGMTVKQARDAAGVHMTRGRVNECTYRGSSGRSAPDLDGGDHGDVVLREPLVGGDNRQAFATSLCDQQPVERIAVGQGELCDEQTVIRREIDDVEAAAEDVGISSSLTRLRRACGRSQRR